VQHLSPQFVEQYANKHPNWGFGGLGYVVYKRTYSRPVYASPVISGKDGALQLTEPRSEEWHETVERVVNGAMDIGTDLTSDESESLFDHIWNLRGSLGGRGLWQLGTSNNQKLGGDSMVNCWFVELSAVEDFVFLFAQLMLGGGVGFSVQEKVISRLPVVVGGGVHWLGDAHDADFIVPDKREGWAELLRRTMDAFFQGETFSFSTALIRPEGTPIKTFGGIASGPAILVSGIINIAEIMMGSVGRRLNSVEVLDIANLIGSIVISGNIRRSAQIAIGDPADSAFLQAKNFNSEDIPSSRAISNNTVAIDSIDELTPEFWESYKNGGEPYGLFNLNAARMYGRTGERNYDHSIVGVNPCGEIPLASHESCNLAELFLPNIESEEQFREIAILLYKVQKAIASMKFADVEANAITHKNMRIGLGVGGVMQAMDKLEWLSPTYEFLKKFDKSWSKIQGVERSIRLTTVKPSGTISLLAGVAPGVHPGFSRFHLRRVQMAANDPLVEYCRDRGFPVEPRVHLNGSIDDRTVVVGFPAEFAEGTLLAEDITWREQLDLARRIQRDWADNAVSVSVYYRHEDVPDIQEYLAEHWDSIKSVAFFPLTEHRFAQAPLERMEESQYRDMLKSIHVHHGTSSGVSTFGSEECAQGQCPVR